MNRAACSPSKLAFYLTLDKSHLDEIRSTDTIYFDSSVYELGADEVVVDGGAYIGDTLEIVPAMFLGAVSAHYVRFRTGRGELRESGARSRRPIPTRITAVPAGLARRTSSARLLSTAGADSRVLGDDEPGGENIQVVGLDEYFDGRRAPSLIKMDIEGSEADALLRCGAVARERSDEAGRLGLSLPDRPLDGAAARQAADAAKSSIP